MILVMRLLSSPQLRRWVDRWFCWSLSHLTCFLLGYLTSVLTAALWQASTALLLDGMNVFDRVIKVNMARGGSGPGVVRSLDPDRVQRTVHVGGLPFDEISEETLSEYFSHVGEVGHCFCPFVCALHVSPLP